MILIWILPLKQGHMVVNVTDLLQLVIIAAFALIFLALWLGGKAADAVTSWRKKLRDRKEEPR
jgi:hypothetical protein